MLESLTLVWIKRDDIPFKCELFLHDLPLQSFKYVHHKNKFRDVLNKDPLTKISSTEFAVIEPAKAENLFRENFWT